MKKTFRIFVFMFLFSSSYAYAALPIGAYVGLGGGVSVNTNSKKSDSFKIDSNTLPFVNLNVGLRFLRIRGELEYIYRYENQKVKTVGYSDEISSSSVMGNLYYNLVEIPFFRIYLNGGLGYTDFNSNIVKDDGNFSYSLGFGAGFTLSETFTINVGYRYHDMGRSKILDKRVHFYSNDIYIGIRVGF